MGPLYGAPRGNHRCQRGETGQAETADEITYRGEKAMTEAIKAAADALAAARLHADQALLGDLKNLASDLDRRLIDAIGEISSVAKRLGLNRAPWVPTTELANG